MINTDQPQDITERLNDIDERLKQYIYSCPAYGVDYANLRMWRLKRESNGAWIGKNAVPVRPETGCNIQEPQGKDMREPRGRQLAKCLPRVPIKKPARTGI